LVTQQCNYMCVFCHGEGLQSNKMDLLTPDDYCFLFKVGKENFGWNTATLTGGEPLLRKDIVQIAEKLFTQGAKITLTTNGTLLTDKILIGNYIERVNLSIHTLNEQSYESLVRVEKLLSKNALLYYEF
jgi:cyclic pyranopterin phosphate synthase